MSAPATKRVTAQEALLNVNEIGISFGGLKNTANDGCTPVVNGYFGAEIFGVNGIPLLSFHANSIFINAHQHGNLSIGMNFG